jgi:Phasin protein
MAATGKRLPRRSRTNAGVTPALAEAPVEVPAVAIAPAAPTPPDPPPEDGPLPGGINCLGQQALAALVESQAAAARGLGAINDEIAGLARAGIDIAALAATEMLGIRTMSDAYRVNALFARRSLDSLVDGSAKLSRLGVRLAAESSRPLLTQLGEGWIKAVRLAL